MNNAKRLLLVPAIVASLGLAAPARAALLSAALGVTDVGEPTSFGFVVATPVSPLFGVVSYTATVSGVLTDPDKDGVSASIVSPYSSIFGFSINGTEFLGDMLGNVMASFGPVSYTGTYDCGVGGCTSLGARINFLGSGGNDTYALTTRLELIKQSVPEPGTLALLGLGIVGLAFTRRRKDGSAISA